MRPHHSWYELGKTGFPVSLPPIVDLVDVSVVMPCLNEEESIVACLDEARETLQDMGVRFELIVVDNGSVDRSATLSLQAGARVISESVLGYGSACRAGLAAARGRFVILGDADGTYDFSKIPLLIELLKAGADLALGNRLEGEMDDGAMPWMHRHIGTPALGALVRILFDDGVGDVNCGLRAVQQSVLDRMRFEATGMEFASEMVVLAAENGLTISETPINFRHRTGGVAKLRTWADGWRNLRLIVGSWLRYRSPFDSSTHTASSGAVPATEPDFRRGELGADRIRL